MISQRSLNVILSGGKWAIDPQVGLQKLFELEAMNGIVEKSTHTQKLMMEDDGEGSGDNAVRNGYAYHELNGVMLYEGGMCTAGINDWVARFSELDAMPEVGGHLIKVHSGGGQASAGSAMYMAIAGAKKPVVALVDFAASAAYLGISAANEIIANGTLAEAGSIGVLVSIDKKALGYLRDEAYTLYSRTSQQKNKEVRALMAGDTEPMVDHLTEFDEKFMAIIKKERGLRSGRVMDRDTMEGGVFMASEAKDRGLVDAVGDMNLAIKRLKNYIR